MDKLLLLSILLATFVVPMAAARHRQPRKAFQTMLAAMIAAEVAYAFFLRLLRGGLG